jgi:hypothetical protein
VPGNPTCEQEEHAILEEAFDEFMCKVPIEQRRFLRNFGFSETEIDEILRNPAVLTWKIKH